MFDGINLRQSGPDVWAQAHKSQMDEVTGWSVSSGDLVLVNAKSNIGNRLWYWVNE